jgi:hypothetical protein
MILYHLEQPDLAGSFMSGVVQFRLKDKDDFILFVHLQIVEDR